MRKFILLLLAVAPLSALPLNNPLQSILICDGIFCDEPCEAAFFGLFNMRFGFYGDYIFDTKLQADRSGNPTISSTRVVTNAGEVDVNFCGLDVFATLGASTITFGITTNPILLSFLDGATTNNDFFNMYSDTAFSWSVGGRYALYECGCFGVGVEGQYFSTKPILNSLSPYTGYDYTNQRLHYRSWQVGAGMNYRLQITECISLNPYVGGFWLDTSVSFGHLVLNDLGQAGNTNVELFDFEKDQQFGWAFGATLLSGELVTMTGEGRWGGEKALFLNGQIQF